MRLNICDDQLGVHQTHDFSADLQKTVEIEPLIEPSLFEGVGGIDFLLGLNWAFNFLSALILGATLFFIYGTWFLRRNPVNGDHPMDGKTSLAFALVGIYGGYWGGGIGIMFVSVLSVAGWASLQEMNALKVLLLAAVNILGALIFIQAGRVSWPHAGIVIVKSGKK